MICKIKIKKEIRNRNDIFKDLTANRIVAHFGCIDDDIGLIKHKLGQSKYLHKIISESAKECFGIDINKKLFKYFQKLGFKNIYFGDIQDPSSYKIDLKILKKVEVILIPDTIEHLPNPGSALLGLRKIFNKGSKILISTPNSFMWAHFFVAMLRREIYSPSHLCSYSIKNMENLLKLYNIKIMDIHPYWHHKERSLFIKILDRIMSKIFTRISPLFCDGFIYECVIK